MELQNLLEVKVNDEVYGFDTDKIDQILRVPPITNVPLSDETILGVSVLFGKIFTIVDLALVLGDKEVDINSQDARILTVKLDEDSHIALLVSSVLGMSEINEENYEESEEEDNALIGFYKESDFIVQVLDIFLLLKKLSLQNFIPKQIEPLSDTKDNDRQQESSDARRVLYIRVASEKYAIDIDSLRELIFTPKDITPVCSSDAMGVITLRDEVITLVDADKVLGYKREEISDKSRSLILSNNGKNIAFLVDEVDEVKDIPLDKIEPVVDDATDIVEAFIKDEKDIVSIISTTFLKRLIKKYSVVEEEEREQNVDTSQKGEQMSEVAVFKIADEEYAFDIEEVQEIIRYSETTPVPEAPEFVEGILNLRGSIIPIVSLPKRLGFDSQIDDKTKIVVCIIRDEKIGFIVDDVNEILFVEDKYISKSQSNESIFDEIINLDNGNRVILKVRVRQLLDAKDIEMIQVMKNSETE